MTRSRSKQGSTRRPVRPARTARLIAALRRYWDARATRFLIRAPVIIGLLFILPVLVPSGDARLIRLTLDSLAVARFFVHSAVHVAGPTFSIGATRIEIVPDCTPLFPTLLLVGGMLAFPAPWRWKAIGALVGALFLWIYNMVRIYTLMAVLRYAPRHFDAIHVFLWQSLTMVSVVACFMLWIRMSEARAPSA